MRNELREDIQGLLEVSSVPVGQKHSEHHVDHAQDDGDLHLERIQEDNLVLGNLPTRIDAKRVWSAVIVCGFSRVDQHVLSVHDLIWSKADLPGRPKDVQALGKDIVVDQPRVDAEHGHEGDEVAPIKEVLPDLVVNFPGLKKDIFNFLRSDKTYMLQPGLSLHSGLF